jgi:hypothetical protein
VPRRLHGSRMTGLTFRELEAFTRPGLPGFLAFFHARIAAQQSIGLERGAQINIDLQEGARNRQARRTGLAAGAATGSVDRDIVGVRQLHCLQWL